MTRRCNLFGRKLSPLLGAGMLLQAASCAIDPAALTQGLVGSILSQLIAGIVFGLFNIPVTVF